MSSTETAEVFPTEPVTVDVRSVDSALSQMWRKAAEGVTPGISAPLSRVLLLNIIVYAATDTEADIARDVITEIAGNFPARAVIADTEQVDSLRPLDANVSMLCSIGEHGRRLCGEEIRLHAHGAENAVIGSILPILAPDLPNYLWTPGNFTSGSILASLVDISDNWILDTRATSNWTDTLSAAISYGATREDGVKLHDLAWAAVAHWREIIAEQFDPPSTRSYLTGITKIGVEYGAKEANKPSAEAIMLAAWLIRRLGWQVHQVVEEKTGSWKIHTGSDNYRVVVEMRPIAGTPISQVTIESQIDDKQAVFASKRIDGSDEIAIEVSGTDIPKISRTVQSPLPTLAATLCRVLDVPGRDSLYYDTFATITKLMQQIESQV